MASGRQGSGELHAGLVEPRPSPSSRARAELRGARDASGETIGRGRALDPGPRTCPSLGFSTEGPGSRFRQADVDWASVPKSKRGAAFSVPHAWLTPALAPRLGVAGSPTVFSPTVGNSPVFRKRARRQLCVLHRTVMIKELVCQNET